MMQLLFFDDYINDLTSLFLPEHMVRTQDPGLEKGFLFGLVEASVGGEGRAIDFWGI
jgi:hypothetical protein